MNTLVLDGKLYAEMVRNGAANLNKNREEVNDLNVFPVPDGDTGDNMYLTIDSGNHAVSEDEEVLSDVSKKIANGMLMGARGNSGVILSRIFSGIAKSLSDAHSADVRTFGKALEDAIAEAYSAVSKPVDGTILSVYRDAVRCANSQIGEDTSFENYFGSFVQELKESLARTPSLLQVLKDAGVVDSGGAGFVYIAEGMQKALYGEKIEGGSAAGPAPHQETIDFDAFTEDSELTYGYCTEFLLRLQHRKCDLDTFNVDELAAWLNAVGDSVVCFREGSVVKVHVHVMDPGMVLTHVRQYGEFLKLKIENMNLQHNETEIEGRAPGKVQKHKKYGVVTVANGSGLVKIFKELGADEVVSGGQSMNPPAESFLTAFDRINCDEIFVLPNNKNIIMTAEQAGQIYDKKPVHVIPTRDVGQGYAVLSMMDTTLPTHEEVEEEAKDSCEGVTTGFVSRATRDTTLDGVEIKEADFIGFTDGHIYVDDGDADTTAKILASKLGMGSYDVALVLRGQDASKEQAEGLVQELSGQYPDTEIILIDGEQPIYPYIMVLE